MHAYYGTDHTHKNVPSVLIWGETVIRDSIPFALLCFLSSDHWLKRQCLVSHTIEPDEICVLHDGKLVKWVMSHSCIEVFKEQQWCFKHRPQSCFLLTSLGHRGLVMLLQMTLFKEQLN